MKELTFKQKLVLEYIKINLKTRAPYLREIAEHFGHSYNTIFGHIRALQKKGYLTKDRLPTSKTRK